MQPNHPIAYYHSLLAVAPLPQSHFIIHTISLDNSVPSLAKQRLVPKLHLLLIPNHTAPFVSVVRSECFPPSAELLTTLQR